MLNVKSLVRLSLAAVLLFATIVVSWTFVKADVTSCSASVDPHMVNPSGTVDFSFQIDNTDTVPITWVRITRPSTNFTIIANSSSGWQSTTSSNYAFQTNGVLNPGETMFVLVTAQIGPNDAPAANWTVQTSEQPGVNIFACSGALDTSITGSALDTTPPIISNVSVSGISSDRATVTWTTDEPANSRVNYGLDTGYGQSTDLDSNMTTSHSVEITGLSPSTGYHFQVRSADNSGNTAYSSDNTFLTSSSSSGNPGGGSGSGGSSVSGSESAPKTKIPIKAEPTETIPPVVKINTVFDKPFTETPTITGEVTDNEVIAGIEYSIDGGNNWLLVDSDTGIGTGLATFSFKPLNLDDGNYEVLVRAIDTSGNIGTSQKQTLVIDILPPIAGTAVLSMGPQVMNPDEQGVIYTVAGIDQKITLGAIGGPTSIKAVAKPVDGSRDSENFTFTKMPDTGLWTGIISFKNPGSYQLVIEAIDGAGNKTSKAINSVFVAPQPKVISKDSNEPINAKVEVYYLEPESRRWTLWDGASYGQPNPQSTDPLGNFKLFLPEGEYYIKAQAKGFRNLTTDIFKIDNSKPISVELKMSKKLGFEFGRVGIALPAWTTAVVDTSLSNKAPENFGHKDLVGSQLPEFSLKDSNNQEVKTVNLLGRPTVLTVMNTWSPDSSRQVETISELQMNRDVNVLPVALQEKTGRISSFNSILGRDVIWLMDPNSILGDLLGPDGVPVHYFIDREGTVKSIKYGFMDASSIEAELGGL